MLTLSCIVSFSSVLSSVFSFSHWMFAQPFPPHTHSCSLCFLLLTAEKLLVLKDQDWNEFLQQVCSQIDSSEKSTGALRAKLNLLCYLCVVATHKEVATRLLHSPLVGTAGWMSIPETHHLPHVVGLCISKTRDRRLGAE